jgi:hypothetical protein
MQDPQLAAGVFDAAFGLIVFVVSLLAASALWTSEKRNPRPWKVLLLIVAAVMAVSSAVAGVIALPRAVEALDAYLVEAPDTAPAVTPPTLATTTTTTAEVAAAPKLTPFEGAWCATPEGKATIRQALISMGLLGVPGDLSGRVHISFLIPDPEDRQTRGRDEFSRADLDQACRTAHSSTTSGAGLTLTDAEAVWCATPAGEAATYLALDTLTLLHTGALATPIRMSALQREALNQVVSNNVWTVEGFSETEIEEMNAERQSWVLARGSEVRACKAAFESR